MLYFSVNAVFFFNSTCISLLIILVWLCMWRIIKNLEPWKLSIYFQHGLLLNGMSRIASHYWCKIGCECQFQLIPGGRSAYLLPGLIGGGHNHSVADSKSNEKVKDVTQVRGDLVQGLTVKTHELHLTAALIDFIHELGIWSNVFFLSNQ